ncbi:MAG: pirin family protein [Myxococcales bacterium]|nr:pirin family protein [Myxococcales bacterium]
MVVVSDLLPRRLSPGLVLRSLRQPSVGGTVDQAFDRAMGSVLNIDEFWMSARYFAPHPHAGFSAVTYMLPSSSGGFRNRDSLGEDCNIAPGALHSTEAGAGMLHEEMPQQDGVECHGLQLFIKVRPELELAAPRAQHLRADQVPHVERDGVTARVLFGALTCLEHSLALGRLKGTAPCVATPLQSHGSVDLCDLLLSVDAEAGVLGDPERGAFAMVLGGRGLADGRPIAPGQALTWPAGHRCLFASRNEPLQILVGCGEALAGPVLNEGPFFAYSEDRLQDYVRRYASGDMGVLARE